MQKITVSVVSSTGVSYNGEADMVVANGSLGEMGITPGHAPLLTILKPGSIRIMNNDSEEDYYVSGGVLEVQKNEVTVLADSSVATSDLSEQEAAQAEAAAKELMSQKLSNEEYAKARSELLNAAAQLSAIRRIRKLK